MHERELMAKLEQIGAALEMAKKMLEGAGLPTEDVTRALRNTKSLLEPGQLRVIGASQKLVRLSLSSNTKDVTCPGCGDKVRSGSPFWAHYNSRHARRPFWLNEVDWPKMCDGPYKPPPEL